MPGHLDLFQSIFCHCMICVALCAIQDTGPVETQEHHYSVFAGMDLKAEADRAAKEAMRVVFANYTEVRH